MTVGAITVYSTATQYRYFDTTISDAQIKDLMKKYGVTPTGDPDKDLQELHDAMYANANSTVSSKVSFANQEVQNNQVSAAQNPMNVPWAALMIQAGLYPTGDFNTDYQEFTNKINTMQLSATSQQEKANIDQLIAQSKVVFISPVSSQTPSFSVSGADILAKMNKMYFFS